MTSVCRLVICVAVMVLVAGCAVRQPDEVALALYMRNLSGDSYSFRILGEHRGDAPVVGSIVEGPATIGCGLYVRDWELVVVDGDAPPGPADDFVARITAADAGNRDPVILALTVEGDGTLFVEYAVPEWWRQDVQVCP